MINYTEEFYSQRFTGKNMKDAYMKACKWYASNILSKSDKMSGVHVEYIKESSTNTVVVKLYASLIEESVRKQHCQICKEIHSSFLMSENTNCAWCNVKGYQSRLDSKIQIKKGYLKSMINK